MASTVDTAQLHRITPAEYRQMVEAGAFEDMRVEVIDGLLCDMSPPSPQHNNIVEYLTTLFATSLDRSRFRVRPQMPLMVGDSAPEPDLAIVERGTPEPYHPASAKLVIEVSISSRARDLVVKPRIYAAAGIAEYWVIDVEQSRAVVHRDPGAETYRQRIELGPADILDGGVVGIGEVAVAQILGAATV